MTDHESGTWPRWKLHLLVVAALITVMALFFGLGLALWAMILPTRVTPTPVTPTSDPGEVRGDAWRNQLAAQPMLQVPAAAASTPGVSAGLAQVLLVAGRGRRRPSRRALGSSRAPEGAVAQLAAIEVTVLEAMSIPPPTMFTPPGPCPAGKARRSGR